jgi:hypothetical protein
MRATCQDIAYEILKPWWSPVIEAPTKRAQYTAALPSAIAIKEQDVVLQRYSSAQQALPNVGSSCIPGDR